MGIDQMTMTLTVFGINARAEAPKSKQARRGSRTLLSSDAHKTMFMTKSTSHPSVLCSFRRTRMTLISAVIMLLLAVSTRATGPTHEYKMPDGTKLLGFPPDNAVATIQDSNGSLFDGPVNVMEYSEG